MYPHTRTPPRVNSVHLVSEGRMCGTAWTKGKLNTACTEHCLNIYFAPSKWSSSGQLGLATAWPVCDLLVVTLPCFPRLVERQAGSSGCWVSFLSSEVLAEERGVGPLSQSSTWCPVHRGTEYGAIPPEQPGIYNHIKKSGRWCPSVYHK